MDSGELNTFLDSIKEKLGEENAALISDDLGNIITSGAEDQVIYAPFSFNGSLTVAGDINAYQYISIKKSNSGTVYGINIDNNNHLNISYSSDSGTTTSSIFTFNDSEGNTSYLPLIINDKKDTVDYVKITEGNIMAGGHIDSLYFNATSDKRAKENIQPATYNAIELIKKLQVYTYNYKNQTETVTGILAQDLLEAQPEGLELVSNINATGENGDYMSIKNDKLVFILMKAIQEQQEQIEKLQEQLNKLKESL